MYNSKVRYACLCFVLVILFSLYLTNFLTMESYGLDCRCQEYEIYDDKCDASNNCDYSLKYLKLACCDGTNFSTCSATAGTTTILEYALSGTCTGQNFATPCSVDSNCQGDIFSWSNAWWENCDLGELIDTHSWQVYRCR